MSISKKLEKINDDYIKKGAKKITGKDVGDAAKLTDRVATVARRGNVLNRLYEDIQALANLVKDYSTGKYTRVPWWVISASAFVILYIVNPFDLIPDYIPVLGQIDDGLVVAIAMGLMEQELKAYKDWKS